MYGQKCIALRSYIHVQHVQRYVCHCMIGNYITYCRHGHGQQGHGHSTALPPSDMYQDNTC